MGLISLAKGLSSDMSLAILVLIFMGSQTSGSPNPSPGAEADPYVIVIKTVTISDNFTGTRSKNYSSSDFHFISTPYSQCYFILVQN